MVQRSHVTAASFRHADSPYAALSAGPDASRDRSFFSGKGATSATSPWRFGFAAVSGSKPEPASAAPPDPTTAFANALSRRVPSPRTQTPSPAAVLRAPPPAPVWRAHHAKFSKSAASPAPDADPPRPALRPYSI